MFFCSFFCSVGAVADGQLVCLWKMIWPILTWISPADDGMHSCLICINSIDDVTFENFNFEYLPLVSLVLAHWFLHMYFPVKILAVNLTWRDTIEHVTKTINYLNKHQLGIPTKCKGIIYKVTWDFESLVLPFTSFRIKIASIVGIVSSDVVVSM